MSYKVAPQDIELDKKVALKALEEAFSYKPETFELIGEGWDNFVFLADEINVFRFSHRKVAVPLLEREMHLLKKLSSFLSLSIPVPKFLSEGTKSYPFSFYGHKKVFEKTGCRVSLTREEQKEALKKLAHFLTQLHTLDYKSFLKETDSLEPVFDRADPLRMYPFFDERLEIVRGFYDFSSYEKKIKKIKEEASFYKTRQKFALVHGDLYHRHLIFDEKNQLSGVIDWGDACVSDPVVDLAVLYQFFPEDLHQIFFNIYGPISKEAQNFARFLGLYYAVALLWFGHDRQDQLLISSSLKTLENI